MRKLILALLTVLLILSGGIAKGQSPTNTPTATPNNATRILESTIVPPPLCGNPLNPCSALPWAVPVFPTIVFPSPTTWPTYTAIAITATPTPSLSPTPTPTGASPTPTSVVDMGPVETMIDNFNQIIATLQDEGTAQVEISGTPIDAISAGNQISTNIPNVFSTVKGMMAATNNRTMGVLMFLFLCVMFVVFIKLTGILYPAIVKMVEFVLMIIRTIKPT